MQKQQRPNSSPSDFLQHPPPPPTHFEVSKNKLIFTLDTNVVDVMYGGAACQPEEENDDKFQVSAMAKSSWIQDSDELSAAVFYCSSFRNYYGKRLNLPISLATSIRLLSFSALMA